MPSKSLPTDSKANQSFLRTLRPQLQIIKSLGLEVTKFSVTKHAKIHVRSPCGKEFFVISPLSPSDWHASKNFARDVKKIMVQFGVEVPKLH